MHPQSKCPADLGEVYEAVEALGVKGAADLFGVNRSTLRGWTAKPAYRALVAAVGLEARDRYAKRAAADYERAAATWAAISDDPKAEPHARIAAARELVQLHERVHAAAVEAAALVPTEPEATAATGLASKVRELLASAKRAAQAPAPE